MPATIVQNTIGAISILISLMKPSPRGRMAAPHLGREGAEQHACRNPDQDLDVESREEAHAIDTTTDFV